MPRDINRVALGARGGAHNSSMSKHLALFVAVILLIVVVGYAPRKQHDVPASAQSCTGGTGTGTGGSSLSSLYGFAWSDNVGWICMGTPSCPAAGVAIQSDATLTGYAWSDNVGWIQFGGLDTGSMPTGGGTQAVNAQINGNNLRGWVKAIAADGVAWDGWISLNGSSYGPVLTGGQGISGPLSGYAWDSTVMGWIDFAQTSAVAQNPIGTAFDPAFTAIPARVGLSGSTLNLSWSATCMTSCSVRDQTGAVLPGSNVTSTTGIPTPPITGKVTYILTCYDSNGAPNNARVDVGVTPYFEEV